MKQALELFNSKSYSKAERAILDSKDCDTLEGKKYLFLISKVLNRPDQKKRFNDYIDSLNSNGRQEEIYELVECQNIELEARNYLPLLSALWASGKIHEFSTFSKAFWDRIVENKIYSQAEALFEFLKSKLPYFLKNYLSYLVYLVETGNTQKAAQLNGEILDLIESKWERVRAPGKTKQEYLKKLYGILECSLETVSEIEIEKLKIQRILCAIEGKTLSTRKLIEYLIIFKNDPQNLLALLEDSAVSNPESLERVFATEELKSAMGTQLIRRRSSFALKAKLVKTPSVSKTSEEPISLSPEISTNEIRQENKTRHKIILSESERQVLARIKAGDPEICDAGNLAGVIHSLMGVGFYEAVLALLDDNGENPNYYFVKCHALMELGKFHLLEDYTVDILSSRAIGGEERLPFLHMLASAQLYLGKKKRCLETLGELTQIDPDFRNTRELLQLAKA